MSLPLFQVDAFTNEPYRGNPAAVCLLDGPRPDGWMQQVAAEMNLAETAFLLPEGAGWRLRWFTPTVEVALCGHATLASAHVLWEAGKVAGGAAIAFETLSGTLRAAPAGDGRVTIDLPAKAVQPFAPPAALVEALGRRPRAVFETVPDGGTAHGNVVCEYASEADVRAIAPHFERLRDLPFGVIVTAPAARPPHDFVSRYFAAPYGIDEDPVTGSAHCALAPFWASRLGRTTLRAWQASSRGGDLDVRLEGDRVRLTGHAVTVLRGELLT